MRDYVALLSPRSLCNLSSARVYSLLSTMLIAVLLPVAVQAHEVDTASVIINVGVRDDAKPFSYIDITRDSETVLPGYSGYSIEVCRHVLKQMQSLHRYRNFVFKAIEVKARDRFEGLGVEGKLFMLCGPDSITTERLLDYRSSHAVFLSGMTYAYINPRSPKFPRGNYCENIIGVLRGTTADTEGLADIASRDLLMRFDKALDLEISKTSGRIDRTRGALLDLMTKEVDIAKAALGNFEKQECSSVEEMEGDDFKRCNIQAVEEIVENTALGNLANALDRIVNKKMVNKKLEIKKNGFAGKIAEFMGRQHGAINGEVAQEIVTEECPQGFTKLPIRKFGSHDTGIAAFCRGEVLYYLADYDILKNKTQEIADCDIVMNRFTRSREVYGVYFPQKNIFDNNTGNYFDNYTDIEPNPTNESLVNVAEFYADFNNSLLMAMQGEVSEIEKIFEQEFGIQQKSEDLERFFDSFKINLH